jgi:hypothetical protein
MQGDLDIRIPMDKGIAGWVATHGKVLSIPDAYEVPSACIGVWSQSRMLSRCRRVSLCACRRERVREVCLRVVFVGRALQPAGG